MQGLATPADALFVIHQDVTAEQLRAVIGSGACTVGVLTTHGPFAGELEAFQQLAPEVRVWTFADLLDDTEMVACDVAATAAMSALRDQPRRGYAERFMAESTRRKNTLVRDKLLALFPVHSIFFANGLGIDPEPWKNAGGKPVETAGPSALARMGAFLRGVRLKEVVLLAPNDSRACDLPALILGSTSRLEIAEGVATTRLSWPLPWRFSSAAALAVSLRTVAKRWLGRRGIPPDYRLCTTIHEYHTTISETAERLGKELFILVDGHHPSNYSVSYLDGFGRGCFVASNHMAALWFAEHGRSTRARLWFQKPRRFASCTTLKVSCVLLALNHAGDWSALINRSDTDRLIEAFVQLAAAWPDQQFIIRLHPTMARPGHEGTNSRLRIRDFVRMAGLANLRLSSATLDEDMRRADLCMSEYSQVLVEAWCAGKLGLVVNCTGRRSFMSDYEALGFSSVSGRSGMLRWFERLSETLPQSVASQNEAVRRFNDKQADWERGLDGLERTPGVSECAR